MKFFSPEWCAEAQAVAEGEPEILKGLADAATFAMVVGFEVTDRAGIASWLRFDGGKIVEWATGAPPEGERRAMAKAELVVWRQAADRDAWWTDLILGHKIKLRDVRNRVTANYGAFDALLHTWAEIPTDWDL